MPRLRILAAMMAVLLCQVSASSAPAAPDRPGRQFILRLKAIADAGKATDPAFVAKALGMTFTARTERSEPYAIRCAPGLVKGDSVTTFYTAVPGSALKPTPFGREKLVSPGFGVINSDTRIVSGETKVGYFVTTDHDCSGYINSSNHVTAQLSVAPMSTYDCVSAGELRGWLPAATEGYATDGAIVYHYTGRNGAAITFTFFVGTECLLGMSLDQDPKNTPRYQAAVVSQKTCMLPFEAQFCDAHAPFGWGDGGVQDEMASYAVAKCGSIDAFLARTPKSANPGPSAATDALPDGNPASPCALVRARLRSLR